MPVPARLPLNWSSSPVSVFVFFRLPVPVVILTSSHEDQDIAAGYELGANGYVVKPVDFHQFVDVIKETGVYWAIINESMPKSFCKPW